MSQNVPPDPELTAIEAALGSLAPSRSRLDRDQLMFQAGQGSRSSWQRSPGRWTWPAIAASLAVLAIGEGAALARRPVHRVVEVVYVERTPAPIEPPKVVLLKQSPEAPPQSGSSSNRLDRQAGYTWLLRQVDDGSLGAPYEPSPLTFDSGEPPLGAKFQSSGIMLRSEIAKLLNPGEPL